MASDIRDPIPQDAIQRRSYEIWERENRPQGKDMEHWFRAKAELAAEQQHRHQTSDMQADDDLIYFWDHYG